VPDDLTLIPRGAGAYLLPASVTDEVVVLCTSYGAPIVLYAGTSPACHRSGRTTGAARGRRPTT